MLHPHSLDTVLGRNPARIHYSTGFLISPWQFEKSKKKLGFDEYFDIYVEYFGNLIDPAYSVEEVDQTVRHWFTNMGSSYYWEINAYVYDMDKDGVYECIITYPTSKTDWRKNGYEK